MKSIFLRRRRGLLRNRTVRVGIGASLVLTVFLGVYAFPAWWQDRLVRQAGEYLERGDMRGAFLSAHEALNRDAGYVPAVELMARLSLRSHSPDEIFWRRRLARLQPLAASRRVELAEAALRHGETFVARHALEGISLPDQSFGYHLAAATLALSTGQFWFAQEHLEQAHRQRPEDGQTKLMLDRILLTSPNPKARTLAHQELEGFTAEFALRREAFLALLAEAHAQGKFDDAMRLAKGLRDLPESTLSDRLHYLEELDRQQEPSPTEDLRPLKFKNELDRLEADAGLDEFSIFTVASWLTSHHHATDTLQWLDKLPDVQRATPSSRLAEAEAISSLEDWAALEERTSACDWGRLEYLRFAYDARAKLAGNRNGDTAFVTAWQNARQAVGTDLNKLKTLAGLAEGWDWNAEADSLWRELANDTNAPLTALQHLYALDRKRGATDEMLSDSERILHLDPDDPIARNNVAQLSLLLGRMSPEIERIASENARLHPADWAVNSTYAFLLHLQGHDQEAIERLLALPGRPQADPQMAAYFGILFSATGQPERARPLLALAAHADLLPEEAQLVRTAFHP